MSTTEILSKYKKEIKTIELQSVINKNQTLSIKGLCGNLNVVIPLSVSQNDSYSHCFILADKEKALVYYSNLCNFLKNEKVYFFPYSFIAPYDDELINRLVSRGHDEDFINKRMILANSQREHSGEYDYYIENQDLNTAVNNIIDIICKLEEQ